MTKRRWISIGIASIITLILLVALGFYLLVRFLPFNSAELEKVHQPSIVYAADGSKLMSLGTANTDLTYQQIPKVLQNAVIATEDHNFWSNSGVDLKSVFRSVFVDVSSGSLSQGASTIPEQLAKMVYLTDKKTFSRKIQQIILGMQIERNFTKQEILTMYLNRIPVGGISTGVEQGAMRYFGIDLKKHPNQLTLPEAALLAGLPQAPSAYDPELHPKAALERRNQVLENMAHWGYISEAKAKQAEKTPLGLHPKNKSVTDGFTTQPLLTNVLLDYLNRQGISPQEVEQGGLKIYTTVEPNVQDAINEVFSSKYNADFPGPTKGTIVQGAAVFVDPQTGGILGAAGSRKQGNTPLGLDRLYSVSSPGSSIKPIMEYGPAIESGKWSYTSALDNQPQNFGTSAKPYTPQNWNYGGPSKVTLQYGLQWSQNIASVWLLKQIGIENGLNFAKKDGIPVTSQDYQQLGVAIGGLSKGVTPLQMVSAYTPFDNNGVRSQAYLVKKIVNAQGEQIFSEQPQHTQVMTADTAEKMTRLMQDVVDYGTGTAARLGSWGVAGKTGTVQYDSGQALLHPNWIRDGWFDGYTPTMVGSIHISYDRTDAAHHMTMTPVDPSGNAAKIFHDIIALALQNEAPQQFASGPYPAATGEANGLDYVSQSSKSKSKSSQKTTGITGLKATYNKAAHAVSLSWNGGFPTSVTYLVTRETTTAGTSGEETPVGETSSTSLTDSTVEPNQVYTYTVQATDPNSGASVGNPATVTVQTGAVQSQPGGNHGQTPPTNNTTSPNGTDNGTGSVTNGTSSPGPGGGPAGSGPAGHSGGSNGHGHGNPSGNTGNPSTGSSGSSGSTDNETDDNSANDNSSDNTSQ